MSDLNILGMIAGEKPGYADERTLYAQRLAVLIMVSDKDIGRTYGGELAALPGETSINAEDTFRLEIVTLLQEAVEWMKENDPSTPLDFDAKLDDIISTDDGFSLVISTTTDGVSYTPSTVTLW
jgi:hypothetical protein